MKKDNTLLNINTENGKMFVRLYLVFMVNILFPEFTRAINIHERLMGRPWNTGVQSIETFTKIYHQNLFTVYQDLQDQNPENLGKQ